MNARWAVAVLIALAMSLPSAGLHADDRQNSLQGRDGDTLTAEASGKQQDAGVQDDLCGLADTELPQLYADYKELRRTVSELLQQHALLEKAAHNYANLIEEIGPLLRERRADYVATRDMLDKVELADAVLTTGATLFTMGTAPLLSAAAKAGIKSLAKDKFLDVLLKDRMKDGTIEFSNASMEGLVAIRDSLKAKRRATIEAQRDVSKQFHAESAKSEKVHARIGEIEDRVARCKIADSKDRRSCLVAYKSALESATEAEIQRVKDAVSAFESHQAKRDAGGRQATATRDAIRERIEKWNERRASLEAAALEAQQAREIEGAQIVEALAAKRDQLTQVVANLERSGRTRDAAVRRAEFELFESESNATLRSLDEKVNLARSNLDTESNAFWREVDAARSAADSTTRKATEDSASVEKMAERMKHERDAAADERRATQRRAGEALQACLSKLRH